MAQMPIRKCKKWFCGEYIQGQPCSLGYNAAKAVANHGAGKLGGMGGAAVGATIGSAIFPGIGTIVGGFIGSLAGSKGAKGLADGLVDGLSGEVEFEFTCPKCGRTWKETIIL